MNSYFWLKHIHVLSVVLSISGFAARGALVLRRSPLAAKPWLARSSHVIDTVLLASASGMVWVAGHQPVSDPWLRNKLIGVLAYIVCGSLALKRAPTQGWRAFFFVLALLVAAQVVATALSKNPLGLFAYVLL
jgi:uncharacterized membrane protein SirB2